MASVRADNNRSGYGTAPRTPSGYGKSVAAKAGAAAAPVNRLSDPVGSWDYDPSKDPSAGIPKDYRVQVGVGWNARSSQGGAVQGPIYASPIYSYANIKAMWGKGPQQVAEQQIILMELGYLPGVNTLGYWDTASEKAFTAAATDANRNGVSLKDLLSAAKASGQTASQKAARGARSGSGPSGGPRTVTSKSYNLTSEAQAQQILRSALTRELGRAPTADEVKGFTSALNAKERANPSVSVTTISGDGSNQSTTSTPGNVEPQSEADTFAETSSPSERSMYQNSQYMGVISKMLGL